MSAISDFLEPKLLDTVFNGLATGSPFTTHVALFTTAVGDDGSGTEVPLTFNYARELVDVNGGASPTWALAVVDGTAFLVDNANVITFNTATGGSWGTISHIGIYDAITAGNLLWHGALDVPILVNDGTTFSIPVGNLNMTLD